jgi:hypothetical protein
MPFSLESDLLYSRMMETKEFKRKLTMKDKTENCHHSEDKDGKLMCEKPGVRTGTVCGHGGDAICKSYATPQPYNKWKDPKWLQELNDAEDKAFAGGVLLNGMVVPAGVGAISPELLALINKGPTIGVSEFVKKRHLEHLQFTHYKGSWNDLIAHVNRQITLGNWSEGYRDGVRLVHMPKDETPLFFGYNGFRKFEGMKMEAVVEKVPGREHEPAKFQVNILEPKIRMRYVDIILYRKDVLEEDGDPVTGADWEVISINGRLRKEAEPMNPLTIVRNYRHLPGGTEMKDREPLDVFDDLMDAVLFDKGMKHLIKKEKK